MEKYDLQSKEYKFFGYEITLFESIKILKYLKNKLAGYDYTSLEEFSYLDGNNCFFCLEDYVDNNIMQIEEIDFINDYENVKNIIFAISTNTNYKIENIKEDFKAMLKTVKLNTAQSNYEETLEDYRGVEALLEEQGAKEIQFVYSYECDCMIVRYEYPKYEKAEERYKKNGYEIVEIEYSELKEQLISDKMEEIENDINLELDYLTKDYKACGTDETLTKEEKLDALYNTYDNIETATITILTKNRERKIGEESFLQSCVDTIQKLRNDILGGSSTRYKNELLDLMQKEELNQISKNEKGQYYYPSLFKILVDYYDLLGGYRQKIKMLQSLDNFVYSGFDEVHNLSTPLQKWYEFYSKAKDKYKNNHLYSLYFSFLHNSKQITFKVLKKIFRTAKLQKKVISIYYLPTAL